VNATPRVIFIAMNRLLIFLLLFYGIPATYAQDSRTAGILRIDGSGKYDITPDLRTYDQVSADLTPLLALRYFEAGKFRPAPLTNNEYINDGMVSHRSWIALKIYNSLSYEASLTMEYILSDANSVTCYAVDDELRIRPLAKTQTNDARPSGGLLARPVLFNLTLQPREGLTLLMEVVNTGQLLYTPARLYELSFFNGSDSSKQKFFGIFQGIFFFIIVFNLLLYTTTFDKVYLLYLLYAFFISVFALDEGGAASYSLDFIPFLRLFSGQTFLFLGFATWLLLMLQFLHVTRKSKYLFRSTLALISLDMLIAILPYMLTPLEWSREAAFQSLFQTGITILFAVNLILIIVANVVRIANGDRLAIYYGVANIPVLAGSILYYGAYYNLIDIRFGRLNPMALGLSIETFLISFGFAYRYNLINQEKQRLLVHINDLQRESTRQIIHAQELEQKRIAQDVHDELGGVLAAIKMTAQSFRLDEDRSKWLYMLIDRASANARSIAHNLMPPEFAATKLEDLLRNHFHRLDQEGNTAFYFLHSGISYHFSKQDELMIYRIIMELVNNCIRHALATSITLQLIYHAEQLSVMVEDNGKGFPHPMPAAGMGLKNIQTRVNYLSGVIKIDSGPHGTTIIIQIPYKDEK